MKLVLRCCFLAFASAIILPGCSGSQASSARAQESANELNMNTRFGRMQMAGDLVALKEREEFIRRHRQWGNNIRIVDTELNGMRMVSADEALISVKVAWTYVDSDDLRVTTIAQRWKDQAGFRLVGEERFDGEPGLFGEKIVTIAPEKAPSPRFATVRIE